MQSEALAQEFARLVKEYHEGDDHTKPEAWNLLADYAVDNADAITAALSDKQAVEVKALEWKDVDGDIVGLVALARTSFDTYFIERDPEGYVLKLGSIGLLPHQTFEAAKAAAQSDYEQRIRSALVDVPAVEPEQRKFKLGDRVRKHSGAWWEGRVVGFYSTAQTPIGYCVQLDTVPNGPVQIYPEGALIRSEAPTSSQGGAE